MACWACGAPQRSDAPHQACALCRQEGLPPCFFCSEACLRSSWLRHKEWHREQRRLHALAREMAAQHWSLTARPAVSAYDELLGAMEGMTSAAGPARPLPTAAAVRSDAAQAVHAYLAALAHAEPGSLGWADMCVTAYALLAQGGGGDGAPPPAWWHDEALFALSERAVAARPDAVAAWRFRGEVLCARLGAANWPVGAARSPEALHEAGRALQRAVQLGQHELAAPDREALVRQAVACFRAAQELAHGTGAAAGCGQ